MRCRAALLAVAAGCADAPPIDTGGGEVRPVSLLDPSLWSTVSAADDPAEDRPDAVDCPTSSWTVESEAGEVTLEVDTGRCDYLALSQPTRVDVAAGQRLSVTLRHSALQAEAPGRAHARLTVGDEVLWEGWEVIPAEAWEDTIERAAPMDLPAGTMAHLHLHNHGDNTWDLVSATVDDGAVRTPPAELGACPDGTDLGWGSAARVYARHCTRCHGGDVEGADRQGAPAVLDFDDPDQARAAALASWARIASGQMPPGDVPLPHDDALLLWEWLSCGGPR